MSLIYEALRKLDSETQDVPLGSAGTWQPRRKRALRASGPVLFWCLAAAALSSASVTALWLDSETPPAAELAEPAAPPAVPAATPGVSGLAEQAATDALPEAPAPAPATSRLRTADPHAVLSLDRLTSGSIAAQAARLAADPPAIGASAGPTAGAVTAAVQSDAPEPAGDAAPAAGPSDTPDPVELRPKLRQQVLAESRERSRQIAHLTSRLTRAAEAGDRPATDRLVKDLESRAGSDSNYVLNVRAYVALVRGEYAEVQALLEVVLARDETDANAGLNMAVAESRTGRVKQARKRLERLALAHPDDARIGALLDTMQRG